MLCRVTQREATGKGALPAPSGHHTEAPHIGGRHLGRRHAAHRDSEARVLVPRACGRVSLCGAGAGLSRCEDVRNTRRGLLDPRVEPVHPKFLTRGGRRAGARERLTCGLEQGPRDLEPGARSPWAEEAGEPLQRGPTYVHLSRRRTIARPPPPLVEPPALLSHDGGGQPLPPQSLASLGTSSGASHRGWGDPSLHSPQSLRSHGWYRHTPCSTLTHGDRLQLPTRPHGTQTPGKQDRRV